MRCSGLALLLVLAGCSDPAPAEVRSTSAAQTGASAPTTAAASTHEQSAREEGVASGVVREGEGAEEGGAGAATRRVRGVFYTMELPEGASEGVPSEPDVVDSVYVLSADEGVTLALFRPFPQQSDLDTWTRTVETVLDGIPQRYDETRVAGLPARVGELPGELRWTVIVDGSGHLYRCTSPGGEDAAWLHERCDATVQSLTLTRAIQ